MEVKEETQARCGGRDGPIPVRNLDRVLGKSWVINVGEGDVGSSLLRCDGHFIGIVGERECLHHRKERPVGTGDGELDELLRNRVAQHSRSRGKLTLARVEIQSPKQEALLSSLLNRVDVDSTLGSLAIIGGDEAQLCSVHKDHSRIGRHINLPIWHTRICIESISDEFGCLR